MNQSQFNSPARRTLAQSIRAPLYAFSLCVTLTIPGLALAQTQADLEALRAESLRLVNLSRAEQGLDALSLQPEASGAAQAHAENMLDQNFYAHVSPEGGTVLDRYLQADGNDSHIVLENIARCQGCAAPSDKAAVAELHEGWMQSPGHRENILAQGISNYGFAVSENQTGTRYGVQVFSGAGSPPTMAADAERELVSGTEQVRLAAQIINAARQEQQLEPLTADDRLLGAAEEIVPDVDLNEPGSGQDIDLSGILSNGAPWRQVQLLMGNCSGCGTDASAADVGFFVERWLDNPSYRHLLLSSEMTHLGISIHANGEGKKTAVAVLGVTDATSVNEGSPRHPD